MRQTREAAASFVSELDDLDPPTVHGVLTDPHRTAILRVLQGVRTPEPLSAITRGVAQELGLSGTDEIERLRRRIYHVDVPKLEEAGLVVHQDGVVELTAVGVKLADALGRVRPTPDR